MIRLNKYYFGYLCISVFILILYFLMMNRLGNRRMEMVEVIQPGLVVIRRAVDAKTQQKLGKYISSSEMRPKFFKEDGVSYNSAKYRGRIYDAIEKYPEHQTMINLCQRWSEIGSQHDSTIKPIVPTHLLLLMYSGKSGLGYHVDRADSDGLGDYPIVSLSLGNACQFGVKNKEGVEKLIELRSGDVIMFGGPSRAIAHSVRKVMTETSPVCLHGIVPNVRFNFTFRYAPHITGKEKDYEIFDARAMVVERLKRQGLIKDDINNS